MTEQQMQHASLTTISIGIAFQIIGFLEALIVLEPHWEAFYLISVPLLLTGYYLGLQGKGYRPYRMPSFYGMTLVAIVPYIGSVAVARKLFFTPRQGAAPDKKKWQVSLWAIALFIAIIFALASLSLPGFISNNRKAKGVEHVRLAQESIMQARQLQGDGKSFAGLEAAAQSELDAAKHLAERFDLSGSMGGRIAYLSGELHLLRREWDEAEKDYMSALSTTALDRADVETQAKQGPAEVKEARKRNAG